MTDREALVAAVFADPSDDHARLVLADWLDEHGEAERGANLRRPGGLHLVAARVAADYYGWAAPRGTFWLVWHPTRPDGPSPRKADFVLGRGKRVGCVRKGEPGCRGGGPFRFQGGWRCFACQATPADEVAAVLNAIDRMLRTDDPPVDAGGERGRLPAKQGAPFGGSRPPG